jgi:SAM-dependent methyltransferase
MATSEAAMNKQREIVESLEYLKVHFPEVHGLLETDRIDHAEYLDRVSSPNHVDFEGEEDGGRGHIYNLAQVDPTVRLRGIEQLFRLLGRFRRDLLDPQCVVLDVLGGDGVVARSLRTILPVGCPPRIITGDVACQMVKAARAHDLAAVLQPAEYLILKDVSVDAVLLAYGTHHIQERYRQQAVREVYRVLKPGGAFVLHDFEESGPVARWFAEVVDRYTVTGHRYKHFTAPEMHEYLSAAGFIDVDLCHMYDPFILSARTEPEARDRLSDYLLNMYGLVNLPNGSGLEAARSKVFHLASACFVYEYEALGLPKTFGCGAISLRETAQGWQIEMPRVALVASGRKPPV